MLRYYPRSASVDGTLARIGEDRNIHDCHTACRLWKDSGESAVHVPRLAWWPEYSQRLPPALASTNQTLLICSDWTVVSLFSWHASWFDFRSVAAACDDGADQDWLQGCESESEPCLKSQSVSPTTWYEGKTFLIFYGCSPWKLSKPGHHPPHRLNIHFNIFINVYLKSTYRAAVEHTVWFNSDFI